MASIKKNTLLSLSRMRRSIASFIVLSKPYQYLKALFHIILKIQPFFSIFVAVLVTVPLAFAFTTAVDNLDSSKDILTYREGVLGSFSRIDPLPESPLDKPFSQINRDITRLVFDPLFSTNVEGNIVNVLADSYEVKDNGAKYIIKLKDRFWSDGHPITSDDVRATFNTIKDNGSAGHYFAAIDGVEVDTPDPQTVIFSLSTNNGAFLDTLYWPVLPSSKLVMKYDNLINSDFGVNPISSTDWRISSINQDDVTLSNRANNRRIKFVFYKDNVQLDKALNANFIDGYYSSNTIPQRNYASTYTYVLSRQVYSLYFRMSGDSPSGSDSIEDPNIRKAISYGIDRNQVSEDLGVPRQSVIQESSWVFNPAVDTYAYSPEKANKILEDAGYRMDGEYRKANGKTIEFTISIPEISARLKQAHKIVDQMKAIGIKATVKTVKDSQFLDNQLKTNIFYKSVILTRNFDTIIYAVDASLDPDKFSQWHSTKIPNYEKNTLGLNFSGYSNFRVDAYLRQGRNQFDPTARKTPYSQFQKVFYDEAPIVTLYNPYLFYAASNKIKNIDFTGAVRVEDRFVNFDKWEL